MRYEFGGGSGSKRVLLAISSVDRRRLVKEHKENGIVGTDTPSISLICEVDVGQR